MYNVYTIKGFLGHYPVGTSAVIVARSKVHAFKLLQLALKEHGLNLSADDVGPHDFDLLNLNIPNATVLQDGNY